MKISQFVHFLGRQMQKYQRQIQTLQWCIVCIYLFLLILPAFMPLPPAHAALYNNLVLFAQFIFWGIWWPFVILSMLFMGRLWCGIFCPEGTLTEWASQKGQHRTIPKWIKWKGWSTFAFILTTLYGQLISVYDYAQAALLILGGSTVAAMIIGFLYGASGTRVWCRYLCPVNGVFNLLSRLSPLSFYSHLIRWENYKGDKPQTPRCAPMINIHRLQGVSACHMCGRCAGYRDAVDLRLRSPNEEILRFSSLNNHKKQTQWESHLILFGLLGVAIGAFTWSVNPWFVKFKLFLASWFVTHDIFWPLQQNAPWWILTHYPNNNDSFSWLDGFCIGFYILGIGLIIGSVLHLLLSGIDRLFKQKGLLKSHLCQALLPLAAAGLFLGLSSTSIKLWSYSQLPLAYITPIRFTILIVTALWSLYLGGSILMTYFLKNKKASMTVQQAPHQPIIFYQNHQQKFKIPSLHTPLSSNNLRLSQLYTGFFLYTLCLIPILSSWYLMFWGF